MSQKNTPQWEVLFVKVLFDEQTYVVTRTWLSLPELKNSSSFSYFLKFKAEKTWFLKISKTQTRKKPWKLKFDQIQF